MGVYPTVEAMPDRSVSTSHGYRVGHQRLREGGLILLPGLKMDFKFFVLVAAFLAPVSALADSYKCVDKNGKVSFAFTPCPTYQGDSEFYSQTQRTDMTDAERDRESREIVRRNTQSVQEMQRGKRQTGEKTRIGIVRDTTSSMGREQLRQEERARRRASGEYREPQRPIRTNCFSYGQYNQYTTCTSQ